MAATTATLQPGTVTANLATDPVCGMALTAETHSAAGYRGRAYGFCSATCRAPFLN